MKRILFYVLFSCLGETEAAQLNMNNMNNMDVNQVIARGEIPNNDNIKNYEQWLNKYKDSAAVTDLEGLIWPYYYAIGNFELAVEHLKVFLKCCKDEMESALSVQSCGKLLSLPKNVWEAFDKKLDDELKKESQSRSLRQLNTVSTNRVCVNLLNSLLEDRNRDALEELLKNMDF